MIELIADIRKKAAANRKTIVLPEGFDERTLPAAADVLKNQVADVIILGDEAKIMARAKEIGVNPDTFKIINPETAANLEDYARQYADARAAKGKSLTIEAALRDMQNPLYYGAMMVKLGVVAGSVAGASSTSGAVIAAAARVIGTKPGTKLASSFFLMIMDDQQWGHNGVLIYADCGLVPNPNAEELADIAVTTAGSARKLVPGLEPRVAMLSFSTKGSADHALLDKVKEATRIAKEKAPELVLDGELQADSAIIPAICAKKAPGSPIAGKANILIFPDLNAGNIAYKLTERLAGAKAIGPLLQGFAKPVNDLSRGCSAEDIADTIAVTSVMADQ